jgi:hypothetical protein
MSVTVAMFDVLGQSCRDVQSVLLSFLRPHELQKVSSVCREYREAVIAYFRRMFPHVQGMEDGFMMLLGCCVDDTRHINWYAYRLAVQPHQLKEFLLLRRSFNSRVPFCRVMPFIMNKYDTYRCMIHKLSLRDAATAKKNELAAQAKTLPIYQWATDSHSTCVQKRSRAAIRENAFWRAICNANRIGGSTGDLYAQMNQAAARKQLFARQASCLLRFQAYLRRMTRSEHRVWRAAVIGASTRIDMRERKPSLYTGPASLGTFVVA